MCTRVLIVDEQPRARRSLKALLTAMRWSPSSRGEQPTPAGFFPVEVVGEAEDGTQAIAQIAELHPDVVVIDLQLHSVSGPAPQLDGIATIQAIKRHWPAIKIVVLTMYATDRVSVLAAEADAFLLKGCSTGELLDAVMSRLADPAG